MYRLCILLLSVVIIYSCKKSSDSGNGQPNDDNLPPAVTAIGTPVGFPVTKTIGSEGGTISSSDGRIELTIPPGALSTNTNISIQPITNECPGGSGLAYDLLPNGTKFTVPATYTFHYADSDMNGTSPYLYCLAYQDSLREWRVNNFKDVDTLAKTIKFDILHFTPYANPAALKITADKYDLGPNEQTTLQLIEVVREAQLLGGTPPGQDDLYSIPITHPISDNLVKEWTVVGGAIFGSISGKGSTVTYQAPSKIGEEMAAFVAATVPGAVYTDRHGAKKPWPPYYIMLNLHPNLSFNVKIESNLTNTSGVYADQYHDEASFHVDVKGLDVTVSNIVNQAPSVTPASRTGNDGTQAKWIQDGVGDIHLKQVLGFIVGSTGARSVTLRFTHSGTVLPTWQYTYTDGHTDVIDGSPLTGGALSAGVFVLKNSAQVYSYGSGVASLTVTPAK